MDVEKKLSILADAAKYDASCASSGSKATRPGSRIGSTEGMGIRHSYTPDGRCVSLLKILLTNYCVYDCQYCVNRISSDTPRARFTNDEVIWLTMEFYKRNYIRFTSNGAYGLRRLVPGSGACDLFRHARNEDAPTRRARQAWLMVGCVIGRLAASSVNACVAIGLAQTLTRNTRGDDTRELRSEKHIS